MQYAHQFPWRSHAALSRQMTLCVSIDCSIGSQAGHKYCVGTGSGASLCRGSCVYCSDLDSAAVAIKDVEVGVFRRGWVTLSADFGGKGASPTNNLNCWCQSSRVIALSCGIKISAVRHLVLSQSTRVTDRPLQPSDGQNYDS